MAEIGFVVETLPGHPADDLLKALATYEPQSEVVAAEGAGAMAKNIGAGGISAPIVAFMRPGATLKRSVSVIARTHFLDIDVAAVVSDGVLFVRRRWFAGSGRFDESLDVGWEEEELLRRVEDSGMKVKFIDLPTTFEAPVAETKEDLRSHRHHDNRSTRLLEKRWGGEVERRLPNVVSYTDVV